MSKLPIWKDRYLDLGVTAEELYIRQQGLCWLKIDDTEKPLVLKCTDGNEEAVTAYMLNPTSECVKCMSSFITAKERYRDADSKG